MLWFSPSLFDGGVSVTLKAALEQVPGPRGRQGQDLPAVVDFGADDCSLLSGRR